MVLIEDNNRLLNFSAGVRCIPSLASFGICSGSKKMRLQPVLGVTAFKYNGVTNSVIFSVTE